MSVAGEPPTDTHFLAAAVLFSAAAISDAFTATDPTTARELPSSLRTTAIALIASFGWAPIRAFELEQRVIVCVLLAVVALTGLHEASEGTRIADGVFGKAAFGLCIVSSWLRSQTDAENSKDTLGHLAASTLFYSSFRLLRIGISTPSEVSGYMSSIDSDSGAQSIQGYAFVSSSSTSATCFGAAAGIGTALILLTSDHTSGQSDGRWTVMLCASAFMQLSAAFVCMMSFSENLAALTAIWSASACADVELCRHAWEARRFAVVTTAASGLWYTGLGTLVLGFAPSIRVRTQAQAAQVGNLEVGVYANVALTGCVFALLSYLSFTGANALTDYAAVAAVASVGITAFLDPLAGAAVFIVAVGSDIVQLYIEYGVYGVFGHFTHCSNGFMLVLMLLYISIMYTLDCFWLCIPERTKDVLYRATGVIAVLGTSIAALLFCASAALLCSFSGQLVAESQYRPGDSRYARTMAIAIAEHWLPLLVWIPLVVCRCEVEQLSFCTRATFWYLAPFMPLLLWSVMLSIDQDAVKHASGWYASNTAITSIVAIGLTPWAAMIWA